MPWRSWARPDDCPRDIRLKVLHVVPNINRDVGGPAYSATRLASSQAELGAEVSLVTLDYPELGPALPIPGVSLHSIDCGLLTRQTRGISGHCRNLVVELAKEADVVHNHGLWMQPNRYARIAALKASRALVCSPRGMLDDWARKYHAPKKMIAWWAFERRNLQSVRLFHATSQLEKQNIRAVGMRQSVEIIPNGVDVPNKDSIPGRSLLESQHPELCDSRWLLFFSRLHPKKGLAELAKAWEGIYSTYPDWRLLIVGPEEPEGRAIVETMRQNGLGSRISILGPAYGEKKTALLGNADVVVLPTLSENFGNIVSESLAHETPVVTTRAAPWSVLQDEQCGWWIQAGSEALSSCLTEVLQLSKDELKRMGKRGNKWVRAHLRWSVIARETLSMYQSAKSS